MRGGWRRLRTALAVGGMLGWGLLAAGCDRNIEPYDPDEQVEQPDLSKIFPEGAERAGTDEAPVMPAPGAAPGGPPPGGRGAPPVAAEGAPLRGVVRLAPELEGRVSQGSVLFLIARSATPGPPTAVVRVGDPSFPLEFEIGPEDRMIQALPFEGPFRLTARVDADGNATTRNPGDLQGESPSLHAPGDTDVELVIDEVL